jgi:hypothetical protein
MVVQRPGDRTNRIAGFRCKILDGYIGTLPSKIEKSAVVGASPHPTVKIASTFVSGYPPKGVGRRAR